MTHMRTVHKYPMHTPVIEVELSASDKVVCVATQDGVPTLWIEKETDPDIKRTKHTFVGHGTGHLIPDGEVYVGTAHGIDGWMVFHIYERVN